MLDIFFYFCTILGFSLLPIGESSIFRKIFQSIALITIVLYLSSILGMLDLGIVAVQSISVALLFFGVWRTHLNKEWYGFLSCGLSLAFIFSLAYFASLGKNFWAWDEFSHWGAQVDYLIAMKEIASDSSVMLFPDYIPGQSLWRYYSYLKINSSDNSAIYFGNYVLIFTLIFCVTSSKGLVKLLQGVFVYLCLLFFFQSLIITLYVDHIQALLLLCFLHNLSSQERVNASYLSLLVCMLVLSKHVGLIFALFAVTSFALNEAFIKKSKMSNMLRNIAVIFIPAMSLFFFWELYVEYYSLKREVVNVDKIILSGFLDTFNHLFASSKGLLNSFFPHANLIRSKYSSDSSVYLWQLISAVFTFVLCVSIFNKDLLKKRILYAVLSFSMIASYVLFLSYIRAGTPWAGDVYSFSRYVCVILFPIVVIPLLKITKIRYLLPLTFGSILLSLPLSPPFSSVFSYVEKSPSVTHRDFDKKAQLVKKYVSSSDVIWYIQPQDSIVSYFVFREKVIPNPVLNFKDGWHLYVKSDLKSLTERLFLFKKNICKVDYIYVDNKDDTFWDDYGIFFGNKRESLLFRINKVDGQCTVIPVVEG
ncbi:hypothetical protein FCV46_19670 [Vibrio kanaloae]|uniref:hypothetical protein n=2 Tax=Vibrio kanaloae TaxID=170673 RepID=UPI0010BE2C63|nr:hypothetical protein [Vibrio kanaloae]TKE98681.1 hypothetical protein FCV46_19670 [Vibrio kanaloae]